jgi:hypothetical protein
MILTPDQIKGTFKNAIEITTVEQCDRITPGNMRQEAIDALQGNGTEKENVLYFGSWLYSEQVETTYVILFPNAGRGGACQSGYTDWCDANTLDEVESAYLADKMD